MSGVAGEDGELIDRLLSVLNHPDATSAWWYDLATVIVWHAGGDELEAAMSLRQDLRQDELIPVLRERLLELVGTGLSEAFLVRALRNELAEWVASLGSFRVIDARRRQERADMQRTAEDPEAIRRYKAFLVKRDPSNASRTEDEIAEGLRNLAASPVLRNISLTDAAAAMAREGLWRERSTAVSDEVLRQWQERRVIAS